MSELTLHFEATPDTDLAAAAAEVRQQFANVGGVAAVRADPQRFQGVSASEILSVIKVGTEIAQSAAGLLTALAGVWAAYEKLRARFPGLRPPTVEIGLKKVPVDAVTEEDAAQLLREG